MYLASAWHRPQKSGTSRRLGDHPQAVRLADGVRVARVGAGRIAAVAILAAEALLPVDVACQVLGRDEEAERLLLPQIRVAVAEDARVLVVRRSAAPPAVAGAAIASSSPRTCSQAASPAAARNRQITSRRHELARQRPVPARLVLQPEESTGHPRPIGAVPGRVAFVESPRYGNCGFSVAAGFSVSAGLAVSAGFSPALGFSAPPACPARRLRGVRGLLRSPPVSRCLGRLLVGAPPALSALRRFLGARRLVGCPPASSVPAGFSAARRLVGARRFLGAGGRLGRGGLFGFRGIRQRHLGFVHLQFPAKAPMRSTSARVRALA